MKKTNKKNQQIRWWGPVGGALSPLCPPCPRAVQNSRLQSCHWCALKFCRCHGAGSSERELLEQTPFLPMFPTLYSVLGSGQWGFIILCVLFTNLSLEMFPEVHCSIEKTGATLPKSCLGSRSSWQPGVPHIAFLGLFCLDPSLSESQLWDLLFTEPPLPPPQEAGGRVPPGCLCHPFLISGHETFFSSRTNYFNYIISDRSRRSLEETAAGSITKIFSGTTVKSCICIFLSLWMNCTTM